METLFFVVGWVISLAGLYAVHKIIVVAQKHEK